MCVVCVCLILCNLEPSTVRRPWSKLDCYTSEDSRIMDCVCISIVDCVYIMNLVFVCHKFTDSVCSGIAGSYKTQLRAATVGFNIMSIIECFML